MLVALRQPSVAVFVPVSFTALFGFGLVTSARVALATPSWGAGFGFVVAAAIFSFVLSMFRVVWLSGDRIVSRGLFHRRELDPSTTAIGVRREGGRSANHEVYATDGKARFPIASCFTERGANRVAARLAWALGLDDDAVDASAPAPQHASG